MILVGAGIVALALAAELVLRQAYGLGTPVLYAPHPRYGYRPRPNQTVHRKALVRINNLGLRGRDWDEERGNKILFLGDSVTYGGSFITNQELFSELAVAGLDGWCSGNAGVNAWGVENVHGLIVGAGFTPAAVYVSTLPERDFFRGLMRISRLPYWCHQPGSALEEAGYFLLHGFMRLDHCAGASSGRASPPGQGRPTLERAVQRLAQMDSYLKRRGHRHLIFISPTRAQLVHGRPRNARLRSLLERAGLEVTYLLDEALLAGRPLEERDRWFVDQLHLSREGHRAWARVIRAQLKRLLERSNGATPSHPNRSGASRVDR